MQPGDVVRLKDGTNLDVGDVEVVELPEGEYVAVYNFEVADFHTYFVSNFDILVHNYCKKDIENLRKGKDYYASSIKEAKSMLKEMPDLRPAPRGKMNPFLSDPRGTYRGDLYNAIKTNPKTGEKYKAAYIHPPERVTKHPDHAKYPHYNLYFRNGTKSAIIIKGTKNS